MTANDYDICKAVAEMEDNILGVGIIEDMEVTALFYKRNVPVPKEEKFKLMVVQYEMIVSIVKSNTDFFWGLSLSQGLV
jgi:hypothetical protein